MILFGYLVDRTNSSIILTPFEMLGQLDILVIARFYTIPYTFFMQKFKRCRDVPSLQPALCNEIESSSSD